MKKYMVLIALLVISFNANAALLQSKQYQTIQGELFTHNLNGPASDGTGGTLTVHTRGDFFAGGQFNENISVSLDGNLLGSGISFDSIGAYNVTDYSFDDKEFSIDFNIGSSLLSAVMSDLLAVVLVDFGAGMNPFSKAYFSEVTLSYNSSVSQVPVPAAIWLFGSALVGFFGLRRKSKITE